MSANHSITERRSSDPVVTTPAGVPVTTSSLRTPTSVELLGGRIFVRASLADLPLCPQIPGGFWDAARKAWSYPATELTARALRSKIRRLATTGQFDAAFPATLPATPAKPRRPIPVPTAATLPAPEIPDGLLTRPWRHQVEAYQFCRNHLSQGQHGLLLAMMMGTGKSLVACMMLLALAARKTLIACPLRVVQVWLGQFERHIGTPMVVVALDEDAGSVASKQQFAEEKLKLAQTLGQPFVAVINYDSVWREPFAEWAEKVEWDLVIADEAHRIKAPGGKASLFFKRLRPHARIRVAMTGTPMPHGLTDVYAVARFTDPTIFGPSFAAFRQKYCVMGGFQKKQITGYQHLEEFEALLSRFTFRVGKEVLDLPPETHVTYHCELSPDARRIYRDLEEDFVAQVREGVVTATNAMVKLLRLQQVTGGVVPTDDGAIHRVDNAKQELLADTLEDIGNDEPVVVFCRFHADLDAVHEAAKRSGCRSLELSGRRDELKRWQDGEAQVLAVQISAGGVGVDLTRARYSIYYSLSFSLGEYDQALSRVHRPGQTRPVEHIHLVARNTVDVKILRALEKRAEVLQSILAEIKS
ncbi:MAG: DEAD/DEAH box helicase [Acidobacteria bacterium]|nr:DEAD/DEAH box helicase [Acidobacteriota bacterium]